MGKRKWKRIRLADLASAEEQERVLKVLAQVKDPPAPIETPPLHVIVCPNPFRQAHEEHWLAPAQSLMEILREVQPDIDHYCAHVWVNDEYIVPEDWEITYPPPGSEIAIRVVPQGPVGRIIGQIFIAIAAIAAVFLVPYAFPALAGTVWPAIIGLGVGILSNLALNALFPPFSNPARQAQLTGTGLGFGSSIADSPTYSLSGGRNQANKYGPVPKILGRHKMSPLYGARTYTEVVGNNQYLRCLFVWGFAPVQIEDLRIGQTPLANFQGVEIEHRNLHYKDPDGNIIIYGDDPLTLYTANIQEEALTAELLQGAAVIRTSHINPDELSVQITHPNGLQAMDSGGGTSNYAVTHNIFYRETGTSGPWLSPAGTDDAGNSNNGILTITANSRSAVRDGLRWPVTPAPYYDVKILRVSPGPDDIWHQSIGFWTALRTIRAENPLKFPIPLAVTAVRIKASGQLTGTLDEFSGIATGIYPDWDKETQTWITRVTSNPASLFREWMQGPHKQDPFLDSEIDLEKLQEWHEYCEGA